MIRISAKEKNSIDIALEALSDKKIIAYPTDTIYGIGTDINNDYGIDRINHLKKRSQPMSIVISDIKIIEHKVLIAKNFKKEIQKIIPFGDTCIVDYIENSFNNKITQDGKIGFRVPNHPFLKKLLNKYNKPITTTSINETGDSPLVNPDEIEKKFGNKIDLLIDDGIINNPPSSIYLFDNENFKKIR